MIGGQKFIWKEVERDDELIEYIIEAEKDFWKMVKDKTPPALDGSSAAEKWVNERYKKVNEGEVINLDSSWKELLNKRKELKEYKDNVEQEIKEIENQLKQNIGHAEYANAPGYSISLKQSVRKNLDSLKIKELLKDDYEKYLKEKAPQYMSSIVNLVNSDTNLQKCEGMSVIASCMVAATMDLPVDKNLGYAWVVPYGNRAQFQMGYKGYIQLALRTGQYKSINVVEIREGELVSWNPLTEEIEVDFSKRESDAVIGYAGYFKLINGFEKTVFWTKEEVNNHANKFSKTVNSKNSVWKSNFDAMAKKTVLRNLLSKWGILSIEMQKAYTADENLINKGLMDDIENVQANIEGIQENNENEGVIEADYTVDSNNEVLEGQQDIFEGTSL